MTKTPSWIGTSDVLSIFPTLVWKIEFASEVRERVNVAIAEALQSIRPPRTAEFKP